MQFNEYFGLIAIIASKEYQKIILILVQNLGTFNNK